MIGTGNTSIRYLITDKLLLIIATLIIIVIIMIIIIADY